MFVLFATKPLNDGTQGFRFNFAGVKGLTRKRTTQKRWGVETLKCTTAFHIGYRTVYIENKANRFDLGRKLRHFAG